MIKSSKKVKNNRKRKRRIRMSM